MKKFEKKLYLDPVQADRRSAYDLNKDKTSKLSKWAQVEYPKPPDPPDYKTISFVTFEPKLWKFRHEPSIPLHHASMKARLPHKLPQFWLKSDKRGSFVIRRVRRLWYSIWAHLEFFQTFSLNEVSMAKAMGKNTFQKYLRYFDTPLIF